MASIQSSHEWGGLMKRSSTDNLDLMIAAQALALDLALVSSDAVFRRVKGLKTEDWNSSESSATARPRPSLRPGARWRGQSPLASLSRISLRGPWPKSFWHHPE